MVITVTWRPIHVRYILYFRIGAHKNVTERVIVFYLVADVIEVCHICLSSCVS